MKGQFLNTLRPTRLLQRSIVILLFFFSTGYLFSQESNRRVTFGVSVSPKMALQVYEGGNLRSANLKFTGTTYLDLYFDLNSRLQIKSGIGLHYFPLNWFDYSPLLGCDAVNAVADPTNSYYKTSINSYFIGIPIGIKIKVSGEENHFYIKTGLENLLLISSNQKVFLHECGIPTIELPPSNLFVLRNYLMVLNAGVGYEFAVGPAKLFIEPLTEFSITPVLKKSNPQGTLTANSRLFNLGIVFGVRI